MAQKSARRARREPDPCGECSECVCLTPRRNRVKLISMAPAGDSIPRKSRFQIMVRKRWVLPHSIKRLRIPGSIGLRLSFAGFLPGWASVGGEAASRPARAPAIDTILGVESPAADSASSPTIRCERGALAGTSRLLRCPHRQSRCQLELFENTEWKQSLAAKRQSQTRVICATPVGKGAASGRSKRFLCCVCRSPR